MNFVKVFVSLMILFVAINLVLTIYHVLNRKWREGLENNMDLQEVIEDIECGPSSFCEIGKNPPTCYGSNKPCSVAPTKPTSTNTATPAPTKPTSNTATPVARHKPTPNTPTAAVKATVCPNGCTHPTDIDGDCGSLKKDAAGNYYKECYAKCADITGPGGKPCYDQQCKSCGAFKVTGLWDKDGNYIGQEDGVQKTAPPSIADGAKAAGTSDGTLDSDTADAYAQAVAPQSSSPTAVDTSTCDILAIHNSSAHNSTYGQWFPANISNLNLTQTQYEEAGRKFLNEESIKKGVRGPLILDSEAEVLGRLLWKVHLAAITQSCLDNSPNSVTTTMKDELALMQKVHKIQSGKAASSISSTACAINSSTQPIQTANCPTTGMMTDNRPGAGYTTTPSATNSISSTVPIYNTGTYTGYTTGYKPANPNVKPKPYDSIWDIF